MQEGFTPAGKGHCLDAHRFKVVENFKHLLGWDDVLFHHVNVHV